MTFELEIFGTSFVSESTRQTVKNAIEDFDSQVGFSINTSYNTYWYDSSDIYCSDPSYTVSKFEDWLASEGALTADKHFMLLHDKSCSDWAGVAAYHVGKDGSQKYSPQEYGISVIQTNDSESSYKNTAIQELGHTIMGDVDGSCDSSDPEHACGGVYSYSTYDASPMISGYTGTAASEGWDICYGDPIDHDGGYTTDITSCTENHTEDYVAAYNL